MKKKLTRDGIPYLGITSLVIRKSITHVRLTKLIMYKQWH